MAKSDHDHTSINMTDIKPDDHIDHSDEVDGHHRDLHNGRSSATDNTTRTSSTASIDGHHRSSMEKLRRSSVHRSNKNVERSNEDIDPLLETESVPKAKPPLADSENGDDDDDDDDDDNVNTSHHHPGVDDGFFPDDAHHHNPKHNHDGDRPGHTPHNGSAAPRKPSFPFPPDYDGDVIYDAEGNPTVIPDVNVYQHKKTLAQGMMDLALLSANANQLRYVLESRNRHPYYYLSLTFISMSLILQVAVGVGLILNSRYNVKKDDHICKANKVNDLTVLGVFLVTIVNVFITSFGVADTGPTT